MESYFKAVLPEPFRILGLTLRPLSLGRYLLLKRFDCAFVAEVPALPEPGDLILGIFICSMRCDDFMAALETAKIWKEMEGWGKKIFGTTPARKGFPRRTGRLVRIFAASPRPFNYLEKVVLFKRYLSEGMEMPEYFEKETGQMSGAHWSQSIEVVLRSELNWSTEEIQEAPLSKGISDYYKWLENKDVIQLLTEQDRELMAAAEANSALLI